MTRAGGVVDQQPLIILIYHPVCANKEGDLSLWQPPLLSRRGNLLAHTSSSSLKNKQVKLCRYRFDDRQRRFCCRDSHQFEASTREQLLEVFFSTFAAAWKDHHFEVNPLRHRGFVDSGNDGFKQQHLAVTPAA